MPPEIYAAGVSAAAQNDGAAKACIDFMRGPEAVRLIRVKGMEPG